MLLRKPDTEQLVQQVYVMSFINITVYVEIEYDLIHSVLQGNLSMKSIYF